MWLILPLSLIIVSVISSQKSLVIKYKVFSLYWYIKYVYSSLREGFKKKLEISNRGGKGVRKFWKIFQLFSRFIYLFFFWNGHFLILHVSWPENAKNGMKKVYPTGHVKKDWIFSNFRGEGVSEKLKFSNFFFLNPSLSHN